MSSQRTMLERWRWWYGEASPRRPWGTADRWVREVVGLSWAKLTAVVRDLEAQAA
jgi:hypothetical protein